MNLKIYTATEAAEAMQTPREKIDAACASGALFAVNDKLTEKSRNRWRIHSESLLDWHRRGRPLVPERVA